MPKKRPTLLTKCNRLQESQKTECRRKLILLHSKTSYSTKPGALLARMNPTTVRRSWLSEKRSTRRRLHPHPRDIQSWWSARSIQTYPGRAPSEPGGLRCASNGHDAGPAFVLRFSSLEPPCQQPIESLQPFNYRTS